MDPESGVRLDTSEPLALLTLLYVNISAQEPPRHTNTVATTNRPTSPFPWLGIWDFVQHGMSHDNYLSTSLPFSSEVTHSPGFDTIGTTPSRSGCEMDKGLLCKAIG